MNREATEKVRLVLPAKVEKKATVWVAAENAGQVARILNGKIKWRGDDYITGFTVDFGGGVQVDVAVVNGEPTPYVDVVLFDEGREVMTGTVKDCLAGTSSFLYQGCTYTVEVVEG